MRKPPWHLLKLGPGLAVEFFGLFSRFEYALKAAGYRASQRGGVVANWDKFAKDHDAAFDHTASPALAKAAGYLLASPPRKQVIKNGGLRFVDAHPSGQDLEKLLIYVRRVRNNLFHGGKFGPVEQAGRDEELVACAMEVISACIGLHPDVQAHFDA